MASKCGIAGMVLCLLLFQIALGQVHVTSTVMKQALIFRPNQEVIRGTIAEIGEQSIVVLSSGQEIAVPIADISRIIWTCDPGPARGFLCGAILGGYASSYIYTRSLNNNGFFETGNALMFFLVVPPSMAIGAGIGYLINPGSARKEVLFDLAGSDEERARERVRLIEAATDGSRGGDLHVTLQASQVFAHMPELNLPNSFSSYEISRVTGFNLLRKAQVTYSVAPEWEIGVALVWFGEPLQSSYGYEYSYSENPDSNLNKTLTGLQSFEAFGKCIVASYNPLYYILDSRFVFKVGGGFGTASINFKRTTSLFTWSYDGYGQNGTNSLQDSYFRISDDYPVGYIFGQIEFTLVDGFSLGLVADKVFGPSSDVPAVPEANIPARTLSFENTSVGFSINFSF
jgi:hypothetical protein